jgi:type IV secretory pathway VirB10-like protein
MQSDPPVRRPLISRPATRTAVVPLAIGLLFVGTAVFAKMVDARGDREESALGLPPVRMTSIAAPVPMQTPKPVTAAAFVPHGAPVVLKAAPPSLVYSPRLTRMPASGFAPAKAEPDRFSGSALLLDLFPGGTPRADSAAMSQDQPTPAPEVSGTRADPTGDAIAAANAATAQADTGTGNDRFAQRVGSKPADAAQAQQIQNLDRMIPQGSIVSAVMETALNSDLPGYARALVTRDVLSFDGSAVLIPAGSRVIGEYNSGVAQGASRIFIVWIRLIRPDGVAIALGSPAVDELGRGGLGGKVNRHFLQRFGGAILLSVLGGGINALGASIGGGSTIVVNSTNEANSLITQAARGTDIPPTIKTNQGELVKIFVARDLDFTSVGPARQ